MKDAPTCEYAGMTVSGVKPSIEILLATRNNADFLEPLLESLLAQSEQDFNLVVSDDCSTDDTIKILRAKLPYFRNPVKITRRDTPSGSAAANFGGLMRQSRGDFVFLCDADDVWHPDKIALFLRRAVEMEGKLGRAVPLFLFSDAQIIDTRGERTRDSYWAFKNTDPARCLTLSRLLVCTPMIGCATLMNRALVERAQNVPVGQVTGHDWWALLVASCFGVVDFLPEKTISYRLHSRNASHPLRVTVAEGLRIKRVWRDVRRRMLVRRKQAAPLLEQFGSTLPADKRAIIERFLAQGDESFFRRRVTMLRYGYSFPDRLRNVALLVFG